MIIRSWGPADMLSVTQFEGATSPGVFVMKQVAGSPQTCRTK